MNLAKPVSFNTSSLPHGRVVAFRPLRTLLYVVLLALVGTFPTDAQDTPSSSQQRAGLATTPEEAGDQPAIQPRIHNPGLFEKSIKAAAAATRQYGTTDRRADQEAKDNRPGNAPADSQRPESDIERVQRIGYKLALVSDFDKYPFTFGVVDLAVPNAFALPAGQIFVTQGMLNLGLTDDQLAALLGHEIAHVTKEHFIQMRRRANLLNSLATLVTVGAIAASSSSNDDYYRGPGGYVVNDNPSGDLAQASMATGAVVSELLLRSYSRDNEDESDEEGQKLAALAGFDPDGARQLMAKMNIRIPQDKSFGYWQTHPFFDERVLAAEARAGALATQRGPSEATVDTYRQNTQATLLNYLGEQGVKEASESNPSTRGSRGGTPPTSAPSLGSADQSSGKGKLDPFTAQLLETAALRAWPQGPRADAIRVKRLHALRDHENTKLSQSRDYGRLIDAYLRTSEEIRGYTPESPVLTQLSQELGALRQERNELLPVSLRILDGGIYQTQFLESYLSNFPESDRAPEAALQLGLAYSRLQREGDAVKQFLKIWNADPDSDTGKAAGRGLKNLAPLLTQLSALEQLAVQERDLDLAELAVKRLDQQAKSFKQLTTGSDYLRSFPDGLYSETVANRIEELADNLYREMRLYEEVGDSAKAISRANQILEHAPTSRAAQRLSRELADEEIDEHNVSRDIGSPKR